jgi:hypothetical protein
MSKDRKWSVMILVAAVMLQAGCGGANLGADPTDEAAQATAIRPIEEPAPTATPMPVPTSTTAPPAAIPTATETTAPSPTTSPSAPPAPTATTMVVVSAEDVQRVTAVEATALLDDGAAVLYDVRSEGTYLGRHAAGALSFPEADVAERYGELPTDKALIFY